MVRDILRGTFSCHPIPPAAALFLSLQLEELCQSRARVAAVCTSLGAGLTHPHNKHSPVENSSLNCGKAGCWREQNRGLNLPFLPWGCEGRDQIHPRLLLPVPTQWAFLNSFWFLNSFEVCWSHSRTSDELLWKMTRNSHVLRYSWVSA